MPADAHQAFTNARNASLRIDVEACRRYHDLPTLHAAKSICTTPRTRLRPYSDRRYRRRWGSSWPETTAEWSGRPSRSVRVWAHESADAIMWPWQRQRSLQRNATSSGRRTFWTSIRVRRSDEALLTTSNGNCRVAPWSSQLEHLTPTFPRWRRRLWSLSSSKGKRLATAVKILEAIQRTAPALAIQLAVAKPDVDRLAILQDAILTHFHDQVSNHGAKAVATTVQRMGGSPKELWEAVEAAGHVEPQKNLDEWTRKRHSIVHRGERPTINRDPARTCVELVTGVCLEVDKAAVLAKTQVPAD